MTSQSPSQGPPSRDKCQVTCEARSRESKSFGESNRRSLTLFQVKEGKRIGTAEPGKVSLFKFKFMFFSNEIRFMMMG